MARDYKHKARARPAPRRAPGWLWFVAGLGTGLVTAYLAYLSDVVPRRAPDSARVSAAPAPPPPARAEEPDNETRFEFYTILPEQEVRVPEFEITPRRREEGDPRAPASAYVLQVASFRRAAEAERLKASLALIGLEAEIQSVTISGGDTWHRVRLGPYRELQALNETRARLDEHGMAALVVKDRK